MKHQKKVQEAEEETRLKYLTKVRSYAILLILTFCNQKQDEKHFGVFLLFPRLMNDTNEAKYDVCLSCEIEFTNTLNGKLEKISNISSCI